MLTHLAAAYSCSSKDTDEELSDELPLILDLARKLRVCQYQQSAECDASLGAPTSNGPVIVAELRSHVHDILNPNHDRGRKSLLCIPVEAMGKLNIRLARVTPSCLFSVHVTNSMSKSGVWVFLASFQGHMRVIFPPSMMIGASLVLSPKTAPNPLGMEVFDAISFTKQCGDRFQSIE